MNHVPRTGRSSAPGSGRSPFSPFPDDEKHRAPYLPRSWSAGRSRAHKPYRAPASAALPYIEAIGVVTDRPAWAAEIEDRCAWFGEVVECWSWQAPPLGQQPYRVLLIDVDAPSGRVHRALDALAQLAWQPLCVASVAPVPGASALCTRIAAAGFDRVVAQRDSPAYWTAVHEHIDAVLRSDFWLLPLTSRVLECSDPAIQRAIARLLGPVPGERTVTRWAKTLAMRRQDLGALFAERGLPTPKVVLDRLRLARVVHAARTRPDLSRNALAMLFGFSSGDYLGKQAKRLTGMPFGRLVRAGPIATIAALAPLA